MFRVAAQAVADATVQTPLCRRHCADVFVQEVLDQGRVFPALEDTRAGQILNYLLTNTGCRFKKILELELFTIAERVYC